MPKRDLSRVETVEEELEKPFEQVVQEKKSVKGYLHSVKLRLRVNTNYKITGKYSGQKYYFAGAGSTQDVDETDVEWLLSLRRSRACCGGGGGINIFELAGE